VAPLPSTTTRYADWLNDERGKILAFPRGKTV
jgi:hypothetical protein